MENSISRRVFLLAGLAATVLVGRAAARTQATQIDVYKSPTCGCCSAWINHMRSTGFEVRARDVDQEELWALKTRSGITPDLGSCHTAIVESYFVEGHVPALDVLRLLEERPAALGLTVPGMPIGSPGMEMGNQREAFDTLLVLTNGATELFERHA